MPVYKIGNFLTKDYIHSNKEEIFLCTTCSVLDKSGYLVMGAGNAYVMKTLFPDAPSLFANGVRSKIYLDEEYNLYITESNNISIGAFQTKKNWMKPSPLLLIERSAQKLKTTAELNPNKIFNLPWPGIGFGNLTKEQTKPYLDKLPSNVIIWSLT